MLQFRKPEVDVAAEVAAQEAEGLKEESADEGAIATNEETAEINAAPQK